MNVRQASEDDPSRDLRYFGYFVQCSLAEDSCVAIDFGTEKAPLLKRGAVFYPDGGVVVINKGQEPIYYPREIAVLKWPYRSAPF